MAVSPSVTLVTEHAGASTDSMRSAAEPSRLRTERDVVVDDQDGKHGS